MKISPRKKPALRPKLSIQFFITNLVNIVHSFGIRLFKKYGPYMAMGVMVILVIGKNLLPSETMFMFHDKTQYARIMEYAYTLKTLHIPPVFAVHFNFGIGYPVFLFYAPLAYFITALIHLVGIDVVTAVRLSFLAGLILGCVGIYQWLRIRFSKVASLLGALLYVSSPWVASEVFVRGNLATVWFLAGAPWSLWALNNVKERKLTKAFLISASFLAHNVLSLLWVPTLLVYSVITQKDQRLKSVVHVVLAGVLSSFFWIPAISQLGQMQATTIARSSYYLDHFLCVSQLWTTSVWGFGGSAAGCLTDGMSFMLGKIHIILALVGLVTGVLLAKKKSYTLTLTLIAGISLFFTLYQSAFVWKTISPLQVIQFPWRFLSIALLFICALGAVGVDTISKVLTELVRKKFPPRFFQYWWLTRVVCVVSVALSAVLFSSRYFYGTTLPTTQVRKQYTSDDYIRNTAAYEIPEYIPNAVDYQYWQGLKGRDPAPEELTKIRQQFETFRPNGIVQAVSLLLSLLALVVLLL